MFIRLILFMAAAAALWTIWSWWSRSARSIAEGDHVLSIGEFERMRKLARSHPRLDRALKLRVNIVSASPTDKSDELGAKVDAALRRLMKQITLRARITETLESIDRERLAREVAGAQAQAASAEPDAGVHGLAEQLSLQLEQVDRLAERHKALDAAADRIVLLLGNLNLALLEAESSRATDDTDKVSSVLASLEEESETLRRTTEAQEEVAKLLKAQSSAMRLSS